VVPFHTVINGILMHPYISKTKVINKMITCPLLKS
jgi:hypothetical protein